MRQMILLTGGVTDVGSAKTAVNLIRYRPEQVVAVWDPANAGKYADEIFHHGLPPSIPVIKSLDEAPSANTLTIGIAPAGGKLPREMRAVIIEGLGRGLNVLSGLHEFISEDPEIKAAAETTGAQIMEVRKNDERDVAHRKKIDERCLRIHTVGHDCNVGKMVVSLEIAWELRRRQVEAKFVATGQTGIMIEGDGCPIDAVVADFINGAAEKLVLKNQHFPVIVIEGQGSIVHPRYSAVTLGLLHGCMPDGLILCYEMGRKTVYGMDQIPIPSLARLKELYETMANLMHPCRVIGFGINGRKFSDEEVQRERERVEDEFGLPACDVRRHGVEPLVNAVMDLKGALGK
jgi:uncharacterized NAD-dependent epimerase/dehydratase family protein